MAVHSRVSLTDTSANKKYIFRILKREVPARYLPFICDFRVSSIRKKSYAILRLSQMADTPKIERANAVHSNRYLL